MSEYVTVGSTAVLEWLVEEKHCTRRGDEYIFSTPNLVMLLEEASMKVLEPHLGPEHGSVGTGVDVRHLAPTPNGMRVRATAEVVEVDRRRVVFKVSITDEVEPIGEATHERFIVDLNRFEERLRAKHESQV